MIESRADRPVSASTTLYPSLARAALRNRRIGVSSSTTRILGGEEGNDDRGSLLGARGLMTRRRFPRGGERAALPPVAG